MVRTNLSLFDNFNQLTPYAVGFDRVFDQLQNYVENNSTSTGYPPYNIEQIGENRLRITLAVAGFSDNDLSIQLEDNQLVIRGRQEDVGDRVFLHRGIAARPFQRNYVLAEGIEVVGAQLARATPSVPFALLSAGRPSATAAR